VMQGLGCPIGFMSAAVAAACPTRLSPYISPRTTFGGRLLLITLNTDAYAELPPDTSPLLDLGHVGVGPTQQIRQRLLGGRIAMPHTDTDGESKRLVNFYGPRSAALSVFLNINRLTTLAVKLI
jgi:hypothetical protein